MCFPKKQPEDNKYRQTHASCYAVLTSDPSSIVRALETMRTVVRRRRTKNIDSIKSTPLATVHKLQRSFL